MSLNVSVPLTPHIEQPSPVLRTDFASLKFRTGAVRLINYITEAGGQ